MPADHTNMDDPVNKGLVSLIDLYLNDGPYYMYDPEVDTSPVGIELPFTNQTDPVIATMCFNGLCKNVAWLVCTGDFCRTTKVCYIGEFRKSDE